MQSDTATFTPGLILSHPARTREWLPRLAWGTLIFNLAVIVWGAYVRASGSGAGCGSHWPLCNGEIIPHTGLLTTAIEFVHRVSSGACLLLAAAIAYVGYREHPAGSVVRRASFATLGFTLSEALIGAGLVLLRYVDKDQSVGRAVSICLHLTNTFALLASLALTAWWSTYSPRYELHKTARLWRTGIASLAATTALAITGAVTALGDTLFPARSLTAGMAQDLAGASHFLLKLRVAHPMIAVGTAVLVFVFAEMAQERKPLRVATWLKGLIAAQLVAGVLNLILLAPVALQLTHLAIAESLWVALVLTFAAALEAPRAEH